MYSLLLYLRYVLSKVNIIAVLLVLLCLIAPMFIIQEMTQETEKVGSAATATVALGTIIRSNGKTFKVYIHVCDSNRFESRDSAIDSHNASNVVETISTDHENINGPQYGRD